MGDIYNKAFEEVSVIIKNFDEQTYNRIPKDFIKLIETNKDETHKFSMEDFDNDDILLETRNILTLIYLTYIANKEEQKEIEQQLKINEIQMNEKYDIDKIFSNKKSQNEQKNTQMIEYNKKWYSEILNRLKRFLKRK